MKALVPSLLVACASASGDARPAAAVLGASATFDSKKTCCTLDVEVFYEVTAPDFVTKADFTFCRPKLTNQWGCMAPSPAHSYVQFPNPDLTPGHASLVVDVPSDLLVGDDPGALGPLVWSVTLVTGAGSLSYPVRGSLEFPSSQR